MIDDKVLSFSDEKKYKFILVGDSNVGKTTLF
jgi:GTPase SAR1 family protein